MKVVARAVERNSKLSTLWLAWNGIGDIDSNQEGAPPEVVPPPCSCYHNDVSMCEFSVALGKQAGDMRL